MGVADCVMAFEGEREKKFLRHKLDFKVERGFLKVKSFKRKAMK
jgi:hypothetical protein